MPAENKKKSNNKRTKGVVCNICQNHRRGTTTYDSLNSETGKMEREVVDNSCPGHPYIRPHLWNLHPDFPKYQRMRDFQKWQQGEALKKKQQLTEG